MDLQELSHPFKLKIVSPEQRIEGRDFPGKRQSENCGCFDNSELLKAMEDDGLVKGGRISLTGRKVFK